MNAAMPMFRSLLISAIRRFVNGRRGSAATQSAAATKPMQNAKLNGLLAVLAIVYAICPVDILPDVIPFVGWIDDGLILWFGLSRAWNAMRGRSAPAANDGGDIIETTATRVS